MKNLVIVFAMLCVAACSGPYPRPASPPPTPLGTPHAATTAPPPAMSASSAAPAAAAPSAPVKQRPWDVARARCSALLGASDDDRVAAVMFYYGYLAAQAHIRVINVANIQGNIAKVMQQCEATPDMTIPHAFRAALRPSRSS